MTASSPLLITGATDGLGKALAENLAADGAAKPRTVTADFADLGQVRRMAG